MSILIAGGGMAGSTLALAISRLTLGQLPVTVIEGSQPGLLSHPGFDSRVIALAAGTCQQLDRLGVWTALADGATPITDIHVSDRGYPAQVNISAREYHLPALGQVIELHEAGKRLFKLLQKAPGVTLRCPNKVIDYQRDQHQVQVTLDTGITETGKVLVVANGSGSELAVRCGIHCQRDDYHQSAIIANVCTSQPHHGQAFERFTAGGPLALLPMSENRLSLVWCHPQSQAQQSMQLDDRQFLDQLQTAFGWRLGRFIRTGRRDSYPLMLQQANRLVQHRVALVGNAAQTLHPIAGQGVNLGLRDVMSLAESFSQAFDQQQDPGSYSVLNAYQQRRLNDRGITISITDSLVRIFANQHWPLVAGRNFGLLAMDRLPWFKHILAGRTLGWVKR